MLVFDQRSAALKVSQASTEPDLKPAVNQRMRCSELPCVKESGTTARPALFCSVSSPTAFAALIASSASPDSRTSAVLADAVGVDAGEAVRLQLEAHRKLVGSVRVALLQAVYLVGNAEQVLHVVADLVRDDISAREIAARPQLRFHLLVESEVDVELLVGRAVERAHRRFREAAARIDRAAVAARASASRYAAALVREDLAPDILGVGERDGGLLAPLALPPATPVYGSFVVCTGPSPTPCSTAVGSPPMNMMRSAIAIVPMPPPTRPPRLTRMPRRSSTLSLCRRPSQRMAESSRKNQFRKRSVAGSGRRGAPRTGARGS